MGRRGRPRKSKDQKLKDALERNAPPEYIAERRRVFSFVQAPPEARQDGRNGEIDSEVCDAIGQLAALGYFDGHGHDPRQMVRVGRDWGALWAQRYGYLGPRTGNYEPRSRSTAASSAMTKEDLYFERLDEALGNGFERSALLSLVVDPLIGHWEIVPWAKMLIDDELFKRGRFSSFMAVGRVTENDRHLLAACIRGLTALVDGSLPGRYERRAA